MLLFACIPVLAVGKRCKLSHHDRGCRVNPTWKCLSSGANAPYGVVAQMTCPLRASQVSSRLDQGIAVVREAERARITVLGSHAAWCYRLTADPPLEDLLDILEINGKLLALIKESKFLANATPRDPAPGLDQAYLDQSFSAVEAEKGPTKAAGPSPLLFNNAVRGLKVTDLAKHRLQKLLHLQMLFGLPLPFQASDSLVKNHKGPATTESSIAASTTGKSRSKVSGPERPRSKALSPKP